MQTHKGRRKNDPYDNAGLLLQAKKRHQLIY